MDEEMPDGAGIGDAVDARPRDQALP